MTKKKKISDRRRKKMDKLSKFEERAAKYIGRLSANDRAVINRYLLFMAGGKVEEKPINY